MTGDLVPSTELGEAIAKTAEFGSEAIDGLTKFGGYLDRVLGTLPEDTVGISWRLGARKANVARCKIVGRNQRDFPATRCNGPD
jgi:hypothetical protein